MSAPVFEWFQGVLHRECDTVIDIYDQARTASAAAHLAAERALATERAANAKLRERIAELEAARDKTLAALKAPVDLTRPRLESGDELSSAYLNQVIVRICLRTEANRYAGLGDGEMAEYLHTLADAYLDRLRQAHAAREEHGPGRELELLLEPVVVPAPRAENDQERVGA